MILYDTDTIFKAFFLPYCVHNVCLINMLVKFMCKYHCKRNDALAKLLLECLDVFNLDYYICAVISFETFLNQSFIAIK